MYHVQCKTLIIGPQFVSPSLNTYTGLPRSQFQCMCTTLYIHIHSTVIKGSLLAIVLHKLVLPRNLSSKSRKAFFDPLILHKYPYFKHNTALKQLHTVEMLPLFLCIRECNTSSKYQYFFYIPGDNPFIYMPTTSQEVQLSFGACHVCFDLEVTRAFLENSNLPSLCTVLQKIVQADDVTANYKHLSNHLLQIFTR